MLKLLVFLLLRLKILFSMINIKLLIMTILSICSTWLITTYYVLIKSITTGIFTLNIITERYVDILLVLSLIMLFGYFVKSVIDYQNRKIRIKQVKLNKTTSKLHNFKLESSELSENNEVYLTKFKIDGPKIYLIHAVYAVYTYYKDYINLFFLSIALGQVYSYNEYRSLIPLTIFTILAVIQHLYESRISINQQLHINKQMTRFVIPLQNNWKNKSIEQKNIKRGTIIKLKFGEYIPCDILLLGEQKVIVNELDLTGENIDIPKNGLLTDLNTKTIHDCVLTINHHKNSGLIETNDKKLLYTHDNIIFRGTKLIDGEAFGIAIEVGNDCQIFRLDYNIKKKLSPTQKLINKICTKNLYILITIASIGCVIVMDKLSQDFSIKTMTKNLGIFILLLNTMIPLSLQLFYNVASANISKNIENTHKVKINSSGIRSFQFDPHFIVSDKTGTLTTNNVRLAEYWHNNNLVDNTHMRFDITNSDKLELLINLISCSTIDIHSESKQLLKSDQLELEMMKYIQLYNCNVLYNHVSENTGKAILQVEDNTFNIDRLYYKSFLYTYGVKVSVIKYNETYMMHIQGMPEKLASYLKNSDEFNLRLSFLETEINVTRTYYKRIISHAYKVISKDEFDNLNYENMIDHLNNFTDWSIYVFHDYVVKGIQDAITEMKELGKDITILTGDKLSSALEVGKTIGLVDDKVSEDDTTLISGHIVEDMINSESSDLKTIIENSKYRIIYRASPNIKQMYVAYLQKTFGKDVMMIGDGSNDISALVCAEVGIGIIGENQTVQHISDIVTDTWIKLPKLLEDFNRKKTIINNICYWVVMKHMLTAFTLVGMLISSACEQLKDPTSPYMIIFMNTVLFWYMIRYSRIEQNYDNIIINTKKWKHEGIFLGIINGLYVFTTPFISSYNDGISMAILSIMLQLTLKMYSMESIKTNYVKMFYCATFLIVMSLLKYISNIEMELFFGYMIVSYLLYYVAEKIF